MCQEFLVHIWSIAASLVSSWSLSPRIMMVCILCIFDKDCWGTDIASNHNARCEQSPIERDRRWKIWAAPLVSVSLLKCSWTPKSSVFLRALSRPNLNKEGVSGAGASAIVGADARYVRCNG